MTFTMVLLRALAWIVLFMGASILVLSAIAGHPDPDFPASFGWAGVVLSILIFGFGSLLHKVEEIEHHLRLMASGQPPGQPPLAGPSQTGGMFTELKL